MRVRRGRAAQARRGTAGRGRGGSGADGQRGGRACGSRPDRSGLGTSCGGKSGGGGRSTALPLTMRVALRARSVGARGAFGAAALAGAMPARCWWRVSPRDRPLS
eukprot:scaffold28452_cov60-Phaeocystis_antarctica.AAC.1